MLFEVLSVVEPWDYFVFKAKVNNASLVGIGYTQTLRPGKRDPSITNFSQYPIKLCICLLRQE